MANAATTTPPAVFKWEEEKINAKLKATRDYYQSFSGKVGYNPHFFLQGTLFMLEARVKNGEKTQELSDKIMSLENKEPVAPGCSPLVAVNK